MLQLNLKSQEAPKRIQMQLITALLAVMVARNKSHATACRELNLVLQIKKKIETDQLYSCEVSEPVLM